MKLTLSVLALGVCVAAQAAAPVITNITMLGGNPQLSIQTDVGVTNEIQCSTNLSQTNWIRLTNLMVALSSYQFVDGGAGRAPQGFYRVAYVPPPPTNMALMPAGSFVMGDTFSEGSTNELPLHAVEVSAFYMDTYEVTKAMWDGVYQWATNNGYSFDNAGLGKAANHPVQTVNWYDVVKWCNARSEKEGRVPAYYTDGAQTLVYRTGQVSVANSWVKWNSGYRLPTEAEWEKAARGGASGHRFPWSNGNTITHNQANYRSSSDYAYDISSTREFHPSYGNDPMPYTSPVGSFPAGANGHGLYDMAGNVWEWCWDWYGSSYYGSSPGSDPRGPTSGPSRVIRGGSWYSYAGLCRVAFRDDHFPDQMFSNFGFRSVLPPGQ